MTSTFKTPHNGCFDHPPYAQKVQVQDGWDAFGGRNMITIDNPMSKVCEYTKTELGRVDLRCTDCKHKHTETSK